MSKRLIPAYLRTVLNYGKFGLIYAQINSSLNVLDRTSLGCHCMSLFISKLNPMKELRLNSGKLENFSARLYTNSRVKTWLQLVTNCVAAPRPQNKKTRANCSNGLSDTVILVKYNMSLLVVPRHCS